MLAWGAGDRRPVEPILTEDAGSEERLHQAKNALVPDPTTHPFHEGGVVDLVEARFDVRLEHPFVVANGRSEEVNLRDGVLGPAPRAEAIGTWLEVRLEDRLEHQLQHGLHNPVGGGRHGGFKLPP